MGDFDGDSDPDLATANEDSDDVSVLLGGAGGSFGAATNFPAGDRPASVTVGDFDSDSDPDLAVANFSAATVSVLLNTSGGNEAPIATADSYDTDEGTPLNVAAPGVLGNDSDPDGDPLSAVVADGPDHGTLTLNADGSFGYTPDADYNGTDSFTYTASDGGGGEDTATLTITVNGVNDAPGFTKGADQTVNEDAGAQSVSDWASGISAGPSNESSQQVSFEVANDNNALFSAQPAVAPDGTLTFTPAANANGSATVGVTARDDGGTANGGDDTSDEQTFEITVTAVNDAPVANDDSATTDEDTAKDIAVLSNDTDEDSGDTLSVSSFTQPEHGTVSDNGDDTLKYTPNANYNGPDSFTYKANDGSGDSNVATVTITVNALNDAPVANDQSVTTNEDTDKSITLTATDADDDSLAFSVVGGPSHGTLSGTAPNLTYTPNANFSGSDSFTYKANDGQADSEVATVSITVNAINDAPTITVLAGSASQSACLSNTRGRTTLKLSDVDNDASTLTLSASSSNTRLVPNSNVGFGGSGETRTATISTISWRTGSSVVQITANDGQTSTSVPVTVKAGGNGEDTLGGTGGADLLLGQNGEDALRGLGGSDVLCGSKGEDRLSGGGGADSFDGGSGTDSATDFNATEGDARTNIP